MAKLLSTAEQTQVTLVTPHKRRGRRRFEAVVVAVAMWVALGWFMALQPRDALAQEPPRLPPEAAGVTPDVAINEPAAATAKRREAIQAALDGQFSARRVPKIEPGVHLVDKTLELKTRRALRGEGPYQSIIRVTPEFTGPIVASAELEQWRATKTLGGYAQEGVPTVTRLEDVAIMGPSTGGSEGTYITNNPQDWSLKQASTVTGADLWVAGAHVLRVNFYQIPGVALRVERGDGDLRGPWHLADRETAELRDITVASALGGVWISGGADGVLAHADISRLRDFGLKIEGGAWNISNVHVWGVLTDDPEHEDWGVGIINGKPDGSSGDNYFGQLVQADHCRIGFRGYAGTIAEQLIIKKCFERGIDLVASGSIDSYLVTDVGGQHNSPFHEDGIGIFIGPKAQYTVIGQGGGRLQMNGKESRGIVCLANNCRIECDVMWGGGQAGAVGLVYGGTVGESGEVPTEGPSGGRVDVTVDGMGTGCLIASIGRGNDILVRHGRWVEQPIVVAPGVKLSGNRVRSFNMETGATKTWR